MPGARAALLLLLAASLVALPADAQVQEASLNAAAPTVQAQPSGLLDVAVPWTYAPPTPLATNAVTVSWTLDCAAHGSTTQSAETQPEPGAATIAGTMALRLQLVDAVAEVDYPCQLSGNATGATPTQEATSLPYQLTVAIPLSFDISVVPRDTNQKAGPQKMVPYFLDLANNGNGRVTIVFEQLEKRHDRWEALAPEPVTLGAGQKQTIPFIVSTTFHNGYVKDGQGFVLRATPVSANDEKLAGEPVLIELQADAEGFYVPGPEPALLALGLVGLARLVRRRA